MKHRTNLEIAEDLSKIRDSIENSNIRHQLTNCVDDYVWLDPERDSINDTIDMCCKLLGVILTLRESEERVQLSILQLELEVKARDETETSNV